MSVVLSIVKEPLPSVLLINVGGDWRGLCRLHMHSRCRRASEFRPPSSGGECGVQANRPEGKREVFINNSYCYDIDTGYTLPNII